MVRAGHGRTVSSASMIVALGLIALLSTLATSATSATAAGLTVSPASLAFGNVVFGVTGATSVAKSVKITNPATGQPITGLNIQLSGSDPSEFNITNHGCGSTLAKGTNCTVMLTFTPAALGTRTALLSLSDDADPSAGSAALNGVGVAGKLTITPLTWSFGSVIVGASSTTKTTTLRNPNTVALQIDAVVPSGDFVIKSDTCSGNDLAPAASCTIGTTFSPTQTGTLSGSLTISDDAAGSPQAVALTGTGVLSNPTFSPVSLAFGRVAVGTVSGAKTVTITNPNIVALGIASISAAAPFNMVADSCGSSISASGNCQVSVTFNPTTDSTPGQTGKLTITDSGKTPSQSVNLSGTAFGPGPTATPTITATPTASSTPTMTPTSIPTSVAGISNIVTNQGHGVGKACDTTGDLIEGEFYQVSSDTAGQPCSENPGQGEPGQKCDPNSVWNYVVRGHVTFGPPNSGTPAAEVEVQTYIGGNGMVCTGGTTVSCSGSSRLAEDSTYTVPPLSDTIPFAAAETLLPAYLSAPGDGNFQKFYVFAQPIGGSISCTANNYVTEEHN